ncbi:aminotransferase class I/II-fold pyridoxal phosphate-dependent enzyme [bacterium]|nr:aminotransferase class I/II-fold pyridoxal phosphate-dependent enzyme [bacterium]
MSLINLLKKKNEYTLFTTPSHSQRLCIFKKLRHLYKYDISEVDAYNPQEELLKCEKKASEIYKTKFTKFLTNGSTSGILSAVLSCVKKNDKVLIWRESHKCHRNAVKLAGAEPIFYDVDKIPDWGINGGVFVDVLEGLLKTNGEISAIIVTSPTYEGNISDIKAISDLCKKYGVYLIVDEAHGALYPFCDKLPTSALYLGADFVVQSLHKTAGGLNPTALLHSQCDINPTEALNLVTTTSPSYPLLASIEKNIDYLNSKRGRAKILELVNNIEDLKSKIDTVEFFDGLFDLTHDPTKIVIKSKKMSGTKLSEILFENYKIEDEKTNEISTMLLCGLGTDLKKLSRLEKVLKKL